ncbi:transporter [Govanella unica]|uniref:Transporter n=1 Tax=Govanella unica TaxID=2975056 RepID=A0A9X3U015_9PROT|nr:transporter [Govania unica]MDA5194738.1 transporter [Govania unica]
MRLRSFLCATTVCVAVAGYAELGEAQENTADSMAVLKKKVEDQSLLLQNQARELELQRRELDEQRRQLQEILRQQAEGKPPTPSQPQKATAETAPAPTPTPSRASADASEPPADAATRPKEKENRPEQQIAIISDQGGVLTPKGTITIEPTLSASHSSSNRFFFQGVEIVDAVLIGTIEATEARTNIITPQIALRYGLTRRLEISAKVPFVVSSNRVESTIISEQPDTVGKPSYLQNLSGRSLGDIEFGMQYQFNSGRDGWPFIVGNLRAKSTTGRGPFSVSRDHIGLETQLPTGSGFWSVEPSVTMILQSDPAVLFTNLSYIWNMQKDVGFTLGGTHIGKVDPGDVISGSVGIGFALNDKLSMSFGYQHNYIFGTKSRINELPIRSHDFQVGSLLFGVSLAVAPATSVSLSVAVGVTEESPDIEVTLRVPFSFSLGN